MVLTDIKNKTIIFSVFVPDKGSSLNNRGNKIKICDCFLSVKLLLLSELITILCLSK